MTIELKRIAKKKIEQMGATACGVLVRNEAGALAAVSEDGRVTWLDDAVMGPVQQAARASEGGEAVAWIDEDELEALREGDCTATVRPEEDGLANIPLYLRTSAGAVPEGYTPVQTKVLRWLLGESGDFVPTPYEQSRKGGPGKYWWRTHLRGGMLTAAPTAPAVEGGGVPVHYEVLDSEGNHVDWASTLKEAKEEACEPGDWYRPLYTHPHNGEQATGICDTCHYPYGPTSCKCKKHIASNGEQGDYAPGIAEGLERSDWTPEEALRWYAEGKHFDTVNGRTRIVDTGSVASNALKHLSLEYLEMKGDSELSELRGEQGGEWVRCENECPSETNEDENGQVWFARWIDHLDECEIQLASSEWVAGNGRTCFGGHHPNDAWMPTGLKRPNPPTEREDGHE